MMYDNIETCWILGTTHSSSIPTYCKPKFTAPPEADWPSYRERVEMGDVDFL